MDRDRRGAGKILNDGARAGTYDLTLLIRSLEVGVRSSASPIFSPTKDRKSREKSASFGQTGVAMFFFR